VGETSVRMATLRRIIASDGFAVAFQPIVEVATRRVRHYEALARIAEDEAASDSPYDVITFAEATGLISDFDLAMCRKVLRWLETSGAAAAGHTVAVNLSGRSLGNVSFFAALHGLLDRYPLVRSRLMFEVTESARIADLDVANGFIQGLRAAGHPVCLDDFGAGAAAFQYLRALEVDIVKIDGEYLRGALTGGKSKAFLKAMARLCHDLGVEIIAEMVEDERYLPLLEECGIRFGQGYLFGRPQSDIDPANRPERVAVRAVPRRRPVS
jgi:EAL domain-containing protein (putative c-di-GMP-specific phosphodiesterase class I)